MKNYFIRSNLFLLFTLQSFHTYGQAQVSNQLSNIIIEDLSSQLSKDENLDIKIDLNIGYQSNIDLLDRNLYEVKYADNTVMNINANKSMTRKLLGKQLSYDTSLNSQFVYADNYDKSSDFVRRSTFKNNLFLKLLNENDTFNFGPTLSLNAEKRYTRPGFYRKRDNLNGFAGLQAKITPTSKLTISPESSVGYLDHNGTYVPQIPARFAYERDFEEDRTIFKNGLTTTYTFNKYLAIAMPLNLTRENYKERSARFAAEDISAVYAMSLAQWTTETGRPFQDPKMDIQTFSSALNANIKLNEFYSFDMGYKFIDEREKNVGHRFSDTDNDIINFSMNLSPSDKIKISVGYENYDTRFYRLWGGGKEITQTYSSVVTLPKFLDSDINAVIDFSYADYQATLPKIEWQERASNSTLSLGIAASI